MLQEGKCLRKANNYLIVINSEFWSLKHNKKNQEINLTNKVHMNQEEKEDLNNLKIENRILKEELFKYKIERDEKDFQLQQHLKDINSLPHPLRFKKTNLSLGAEKSSEIDTIESEKIQSLLLWSFTFSLSLNSVVVDCLENGSSSGQQILSQTFLKDPSQRNRRFGLKLVKSLLEGIQNEKSQKDGRTNQNQGDMKKVFENAFIAFEHYINFLEDHYRFEDLLSRDLGHLSIQNENISSLLNEYERIVNDKRLEDSAWGLFYKQNRLSSNLVSSIIVETSYIIQTILESLIKRNTQHHQNCESLKSENNCVPRRSKEICIELEEINVTFKEILNQYSTIKVALEESKILEKRREGKIVKGLDGESLNSREWKSMVEENQLLRGINNEIKEQIFHCEKKSKENEIYLKQSYVCIMQFITQVSHLESIMIDLCDKERENQMKIEELENQIKIAKESSKNNQEAVLPSKSEEINQKEKLQLKQLNLTLTIEKKELQRKVNMLEAKLEVKKDKCKYWKSSVKQLQNEIDSEENFMKACPQTNDSYGDLLKRLISLETRYLMLIKTTKELEKNNEQQNKNSQIISTLFNIIEELEEENKAFFYDKTSFENKFTLIQNKLKKHKKIVSRLKRKIKDLKKKFKQLKNSKISKILDKKKINKQNKITNPVETAKVCIGKDNDENIDEEWRKREIKSYELGITKSSLEFIATILIENKGLKEKNIIKDCMDYVAVLEQGIYDLKKTNSILKKENIQLKISLDAQKLLRKYDKIENRDLKEEICVLSKFKEYYKLQVQYISSQHYLDSEFLRSELKQNLNGSGVHKNMENSSFIKEEKDTLITDREDFYNSFRKYLTKCHYWISSLKSENIKLKLDLYQAQTKNKETENLATSLKLFIDELFKISQKSQKFFKRQKQTLDIYQCVISLPTLDQNTVGKNTSIFFLL